MTAENIQKNAKTASEDMQDKDNIKIGYDAKRIVRNGTGLGSYGRTLINSLASHAAKGLRYVLYVPDKGRDDLRLQVKEDETVGYAYPRKASNALSKALWRTWGIVDDLKKDGITLFHGLSGELPLGLRRAGIKSIVTIHDLIFMRHPEYYNWLDTKIYALKFRLTCREADRIIAISECTKRDIMAYSNFPEDRIDVVYQSCGIRFREKEGESKLQEVHARYDLPARYILNVGSIEERKNVLLAVKALHYVPDDISLVIVGRHTKYTDKVREYADAHGLGGRVRILHGIPDSDLPSLYQMSELFVYPSRYEGFGIPIIEAIQCGLPVVACTGSCLEEAGGPDCIYVSPDDDKAMADAIKSLLVGSEGRQERIERSREYVRRFENTDVAKQMIEEYMKLI